MRNERFITCSGWISRKGRSTLRKGRARGACSFPFTVQIKQA